VFEFIQLSKINFMITIQTYDKHYTDQIVTLILDIQQKEFNVPITIHDQQDLLDIEKFYQRNNGNFWLAKSDGEVVGTIALIDCGLGIGAIRKMFVKKEFRGKQYSIAQNLLIVLETWALENKILSVYLGTLERLQAAIKFYERNGYQIIEKKDLPHPFPIMQVDTHFYTKKLF
jgi:putative acetyltransferase